MSCSVESIVNPPVYNNTAYFSATCGSVNNTVTNTNTANNMQTPKRTRKISSSALYEVWRKDQKDVCYLFVPDEYDLVKSHLMFAVREEVEVLKEKISELMERITQLEYENSILRANASQETLAQLQKSTQHPSSNVNEGHQGFS